MTLRSLESYGFTEVGEWHLAGNRIRPKLDKLRNKRVVYAFVVDDDVKYIGICDKTNLEKRMNSQRYHYSKDIPSRIESSLRQNKVVKIFALDPEGYECRGLRIDLVRGLEYPLIEQLDPEWNKKLKDTER